MSLHMRIISSVLALLLFGASVSLYAGFMATDPGVRGDPPGAGGPFNDLTFFERLFFDAGLVAFKEVQSVQGEDLVPDTEPGLGPRFNLDSCAGCHAQPDVGGTSPFKNPQVDVANKEGATNVVPDFITIDGPASGCNIAQPNFKAAAANDNLIFRIPTPVFGAGLIQSIDDDTILANKNSQTFAKALLGISGRANTNGNDGTITRFGWKAQVKSLGIFSGEAYNVEQGVTNELFPQERDETAGCLFNATPENHTNFEATQPTDVPSDAVKFALFMSFLAPPTPAPDTPSTINGRRLFKEIGCALCHTPSLPTGKVASPALSGKRASLFSDLLLHNMGPKLADNITQGNAKGDEFRTAPLWGLGQRIFFLHDGRTSDLREAIQAHASHGNLEFGPSEANRVIAIFNALGEAQKQDILNF
ncbi:MAG: thiol oxidoreductase, partial [Nitrospirae bacterium]